MLPKSPRVNNRRTDSSAETPARTVNRCATAKNGTQHHAMTRSVRASNSQRGRDHDSAYIRRVEQVGRPPNSYRRDVHPTGWNPKWTEDRIIRCHLATFARKITAIAPTRLA